MPGRVDKVTALEAGRRPAREPAQRLGDGATSGVAGSVGGGGPGPRFLSRRGTSPAASDSLEEPRVNAPTALVDRAPTPPAAADGELGLAALLDLFTPEEPASVAPAARGALRSDAARLRAWLQTCVRRATDWGAGPGGAWRAW
jgi:hypothetical protein